MNPTEAGCCKTPDKMYELGVFVKGLSQFGGYGLARVARFVYAEFVRVRLVIAADLSESEITVSEAICNGHSVLPVETPTDAPGLSTGCSSDQV